MVPVNVRDGRQEGELGNRISFVFVDLPCDEPEPVRRLLDPQDDERPQVRRRAGGWRPPARGAQVRAAHRCSTRSSHLVASARTFNLVVSNIPGPRSRCTCGAAARGGLSGRPAGRPPRGLDRHDDDRGRGVFRRLRRPRSRCPTPMRSRTTIDARGRRAARAHQLTRRTAPRPRLTPDQLTGQADEETL